jgi:hypothetical protein
MQKIRHIEYKLLRDRNQQPLVEIESSLGNGTEIHPARLRELAAALILIADEAEQRDMGKGYAAIRKTKQY